MPRPHASLLIELRDRAGARVSGDSSGLPRGVLAYDYSDPASGRQQAVFDLAWPRGLQEELSQPVAVLLNEDAATVALASSVGFRCFTSEPAFRRYVQTEVLGEPVR